MWYICREEINNENERRKDMAKTKREKMEMESWAESFEKEYEIEDMLCLIFYYDKFKNLDLHETKLRSEVSDWVKKHDWFKIYEIFEITGTKLVTGDFL